MIANSAQGVYPTASTQEYDYLFEIIDAIPDIVATRDGTTVVIEVLNLNERTARLFRANDTRALFSDLQQFANHTDTVDAGTNYKYKARFEKDYSVGDIEIKVKSAKSPARYAVDKDRTL